jgi:hypothetical protein
MIQPQLVDEEEEQIETDPTKFDESQRSKRVQMFLAMMAFAKVHSWKVLSFNQPNQDATYVTPAGIIVTIEKATKGNLTICNDFRSVEMERE